MSNGNAATRVLVGPTEAFEKIVSAAHTALKAAGVEDKPMLTWKLSTDKKSSPATRLDTADEWALALDRARVAVFDRGRTDREGVEIVIGVANPSVFSLLFQWQSSHKSLSSASRVSLTSAGRHRRCLLVPVDCRRSN